LDCSIKGPPRAFFQKFLAKSFFSQKKLRPKRNVSALEQGCQIVNLQAKNTNFGKFVKGLELKAVVYFMPNLV
jgi:hypothetical protein